ncbi:hypothetical protein J8273_8066 [Carpediemonas membranifera]|uniref:PWI domain-containing protein n=1 Tax=Carpediemonas membranifera TaxID=201153 RepID=A0A8J6B019_9EUKA|nr:hypothetical protein J8273_8066 [Carpediemonas membranifera]|eukprot:KAG9390029.1 hypothetical protein J8273_8066 [Carpediemonas membranifera]
MNRYRGASASQDHRFAKNKPTSGSNAPTNPIHMKRINRGWLNDLISSRLAAELGDCDDLTLMTVTNAFSTSEVKFADVAGAVGSVLEDNVRPFMKRLWDELMEAEKSDSGISPSAKGVANAAAVKREEARPIVEEARRWRERRPRRDEPYTRQDRRSMAPRSPLPERPRTPTYE